MSTNPRRDNKVSVYFEESVHESLCEYCSRTGKSLSLVTNDSVKVALLKESQQGTESAVEKRLDQLQNQLSERDYSLRQSVIELRELVAVYVRIYLNRTPSPPLDKSATSSGREQFQQYLAVVQDSLEPGRSILEQTREETDG